MSMRKETDAFGPIEVPDDKYWGAQTQRSYENFRVSTECMPIEVIHALAVIKRCAAVVNHELGRLNQSKATLITYAAEAVAKGEWDAHFPLSVWQTGSGTQTNMNVNEVISNIANMHAGKELGTKVPIHPNDDVNLSQSSNDVFPSAISMALVTQVEGALLGTLDHFVVECQKKVEAFAKVVKIGRTHLMDATPITLGQEFSAFSAQLQESQEAIKEALNSVRQLALGGTAVGTGLNAHPKYAVRVADVISDYTGHRFLSAPNKFKALSTIHPILKLNGALNMVAVAYMKIAGDIRLLGSGPRCGIGELLLPANEPGSSIMPGKVNPTQCEMLTQVAVRVMGNVSTVTMAGASGQLQLHVFLPLVAYTMLQSIRLLADGGHNFLDKCFIGIEPNRVQIEEYLRRSLMLVTALTQHIGYDKAGEIAKKAHAENTSLKEAALALGYISAEAFDEKVNPHNMLGPS